MPMLAKGRKWPKKKIMLIHTKRNGVDGDDGDDPTSAYLP